MAGARTMRAILMIAAMASVLTAGAEAQSSSCSSVIASLSPCLDYITGNASAPSRSCCSQLASVAQSEPRCICTIISSGASAAPSLGINQTLAMALPGACNVQLPLSQCDSASSPTASPARPLTPPSGVGTRTQDSDSSSGNSVQVLTLLPLVVALLASSVFT
ncbi:non-specific lipid transfer protein GPI-anchored 15-like isoform X1 [Zingiber officinale]|nr:non-specific lipid transfer protein GPI-anchored 15-like isoform X1 [Zingiber officinale]